MRRLGIVAVSIGVLAGGLTACVPPPAPDPTEQEQCNVERRTIETALEAHRAEAGSYPLSIDELLGIYIKPDSLRFDWLYRLDGDGYSMTGPC